MKKDVLIHVRGLQMMDPEEEQEPIEIVVPGQYYYRNGSQQGKKNMTFYSTPFGTLQMGIAATGLELQEEEDNIHLKVDYALDMNEEHVADCYLTVQAQSRDSENLIL